jgi:hypothetical protein
VIGYLSLGVGYLVGKAMMAGSHGVGGRRYQIGAVLLTYAAVSMSAIPIDISLMSKQRAAHREEAAQYKQAADQQRAQMDNEQKQFEQEFGKQYTSPPPKAPGNISAPAPSTQAASTEQSAAELQPAPAKEAAPRQSVAAALGYLAMIGLASPFLELEDPMHGAIGLIILLVGVRIAWQLTAARVAEVTGPYRNSPNPPASS